MRPLPRSTPLPAIAYLRVSKEEQARGDKTSLAHQRARIAARAAELGAEVTQVFEDAGVSGGTSKGRPAFQALLAWCQTNPRPRHTPGLILVYNDSRWGRFDNHEEATHWRFVLEQEHGWRVRFAEGDDTEDPLARGVLRSIYAAQATAYRQAIKQNAKQGSRGTAAQGFWQTRAPLGYRRQAIAADGRLRILQDGQRKSDDERTRLVPGPADEVALVRDAFAAYAAGGTSLSALARALTRRCPGRRWGATTLQAVLRNRVYVGDVVWCKKTNDPSERVQGRRRAEADWVEVRDAHPALVDRALFAQVAARLDLQRAKVRQPSSPYILSGLLTCAHCGQPYVGSGGPKGPPGDPDRYRFYRDRGADARHGACPGRLGTLQKRQIEPLVVDAIGTLVSAPAVQAELARALDRHLATSRAALPTTARDRKAETARLTTERERLVAAIGAGVLEADEAAPRLRAIRQALDALASADQVARFAGAQLDGLAAERERLLAMGRDFQARARQASPAELRDLLARWIDGAVVDKHARTVSLTVRALPARSLAPRASYAMPGRDAQRTKGDPEVPLLPPIVLTLPPLSAQVSGRRKRSA